VRCLIFREGKSLLYGAIIWIVVWMGNGIECIMGRLDCNKPKEAEKQWESIIDQRLCNDKAMNKVTGIGG
jgi:hypothetical protein